MRILIAIPCLFGAEHTRLAIESVINNNVDLLLIDNGAANDVKAVIERFEPRSSVWVIRNLENIYVNPAWNQAMEFFKLENYWTHLILMNSDLIMKDGWFEVLSKSIEKRPQTSLVPNQGEENNSLIPLNEGIAGVFIVLSRYQVSIVHPIPASIRVWFGDNWIYDLIRGYGFSVVVNGRICAHHYHNGSQNVQRVPGISEIIEQDKIAWATEVEPMLKERLNTNRQLPTT